MSTKALKKQLMAAIAMVLVAAVALGSSTYAWFVSNTKVTAQTARLNAKTGYMLQISEGAKASDGTGTWGTTHTWVDGASAKTIIPVSTVAALNGSEELDFMKDSQWGTATADGSDVTKGGYYANTWTAATESTDYIKETFEIKAGQPCQLILDNGTAIDAGTSTLDRVLRVAFVIDEVTVNGSAASTSATVKVIEVNNNSTAANAYNTTLGSDGNGADGIAKAIDNTGAVASMSNVPILLSSAKNVNAADGTNMLATQSGDSVLYTFNNANDVVKVTVYIWAEGCDLDCTAAESANWVTGDSPLDVTAMFSFSAAVKGA